MPPVTPAIPRKARPGRDGPWSAGARLAPPFRPLLAPFDRVLLARPVGRVEALLEPPARALVVEDAVLATLAPYPTATEVTGLPRRGGRHPRPPLGCPDDRAAARPARAHGGRALFTLAKVVVLRRRPHYGESVNEDAGTPPPIPPYRPGQGGEGPQDRLERPDALDRPEHTDLPDGPARGQDAPLTDRQRALESLEAKADFRGHLTVYLLVMALLVGIWAFTSGLTGFFWPIFPMMGWGLAVAIHGVSLQWDKEPSEEEIDAEIERLHRRRPRGRLEE